MNLEERKKNRFRYLKHLYETVDGSTRAMVNMYDLGEEIGYDRSSTSEIVEYLIQENLIAPRALGGLIVLSHIGLLEVEDALTNPNRGTEHFPSVVITNNIGSITNSNLQQATLNSSITSNYVQNDELADIINTLNNEVEKLNLASEIHQELISEILTLKSQSASPKPKSSIIRDALNSVSSILKLAAETATTTLIRGKINGYLESNV